MLRIGLVLVLTGLAACGGGEAQRVPDGHDDGPNGDPVPDPDPVPEANPRDLAAGATFGDLIVAARRLDDTQASDSSAGCLLRGSGGAAPWRLEADVAVAVRPLPDAPGDLDPRLGEPQPVRALTRWGQLGVTAERMALTGFTSTVAIPTDSPAIAVFVTDRGAYIRRIGDASVEPAGPIPVADVAGRLTQGTTRVPVFVAAEAAVPLDTVQSLLASLDGFDGLVSLAVTLAEDTRLPAPADLSADERGLCAEGLPALAAGSAEGELATEAIVAALAPLRDGARQCLDAATGPAAAGGRVVLAMRIGEAGRVTDACLSSDEIGDPGLRICLVETARQLTFPRPAPAGSVDVALPLSLTAEPPARQRPACP